jgi:hypothetical protein
MIGFGFGNPQKPRFQRERPPALPGDSPVTSRSEHAQAESYHAIRDLAGPAPVRVPSAMPGAAGRDEPDT